MTATSTPTRAREFRSAPTSERDLIRPRPGRLALAALCLQGGAPSQGFLKSPAVVGRLKPFFAARYAVALIMLAPLSAGDTVGVGRVWKPLPVVARHGWLV